MRIFYNPTCAEPIFANLAKNKVFLNTQFVNTKGLLDILELHAGIFINEKNEDERFASYFSAIKNFMEKGENVLSKSFEADSYNTAKECLSWRDSLSAAGWNKDTKSSSKRMNVLSGIEEHFDSKTFPNIYERLFSIIKAINSGCFLPEMEITTLCEWKIFKPIEAELLSSLENRGVKISVLERENKSQNNITKILSVLNSEKNVHLNSHEKDSSFEIWNFKTSDEALEYLSLLQSDFFDVWINEENHEFDSWQNLEGKSASGSKVSGTTQGAQLLKIELSLFETPLNIYNLIEWLNAPLNPLPFVFRKKLAKKIVETGGFYNDDCKKVIEDYKNGIEKKDEKKLNNFLPPIENPSTEKKDIPLENVKTFVKNLENWASKKISMSRFESLTERTEKTTEKNENLDELNSIQNQCNFVLLLLENYNKSALPYEEIESLINFLDSYKMQILKDTEVGSKFVVASPDSFAANAEKTIWCDFYKFTSNTNLFYSFLTSAEKKEFSKTLKLWSEENEREFIKSQNLVPFMLTTEKLVLVRVENTKKDQKKNPMLIQIEKAFEKDDGTAHYSELDTNGIAISKKLAEVTETISSSQVHIIDNRIEKDSGFVKITQTDYIKKNWPDHQSQTSLEKLINLPVDYVVENFVCFKSDSLSDFGKISTTKGNVAHKIIEKLFSPNDKNKNGNPDFIGRKIESDFEKVFSETVLEEGAVLLVNKNQNELKDFKKNLRKCLLNLLETIKENKLHVVACEKEIGFQYKKNENGNLLKDENGNKILANDGKIGNLNVKGFVDMILEDENGNPYIFDFKWTSSKNKHENLLNENKSIQFALYKKLVEIETEKKVQVCAYFLMPKSEFVTLDELSGKNVHKTYVQKDRQESDLLKEIQNSYKYRKTEIENGKLEETTGFKKDEMQEISEYEKETEEKMLVPLDYYKKERTAGFSNITELKGRKE